MFFLINKCDVDIPFYY